MALVTRVNGDARTVFNTGSATRSDANAQLIATGIAGPLTTFRVECAGNLAAQLGAGGAVEAVINAISANATVLAYQVDGTTAAGGLGAQISILVERSGWTSNAAAQSVVQALGTTNGIALGSALVEGTAIGFKLARP
jgi:hypothetical protein